MTKEKQRILNNISSFCKIPLAIISGTILFIFSLVLILLATKTVAKNKIYEYEIDVYGVKAVYQFEFDENYLDMKLFINDVFYKEDSFREEYYIKKNNVYLYNNGNWDYVGKISPFEFSMTQDNIIIDSRCNATCNLRAICVVFMITSVILLTFSILWLIYEPRLIAIKKAKEKT